MEYCALILASSLPAAWMAVGGVLVLLLLIVSILYVLKLRETAFLKKEVMELRDTMRMMRYEEASLARMLHVASKPSTEAESYETSKGSVVLEDSEVPEEPKMFENAEMSDDVNVDVEPETELPVVAMALEESEDAELAEEPEQLEETELSNGVEVSEEPQMEEEADAAIEAKDEDGAEVEADSEESDIEENIEEETPLIEDVMIEEVVETPSPVEELEEVNPLVEAVVEEAEEKPVKPAEELATPVQPVTRKQPINERRPAIPTDLFAAWFAENDDVDSEEQMDAVEEAPVAEVAVENSVNAPVSAPVVQVEPTVKGNADSQESESVAAMVVEGGADTASSIAESTDEPAVELTDATSESAMSKDDIKFCRKLERIVNTRMRNPDLNIDIIAAQLGFGRTNFYRKVRELTGMSPNDYLRKCRMERAAALLRTTDTAISDVCAQVGIPDAQYFSRVFKTFYGTTPSLYREKNSEK